MKNGNGVFHDVCAKERKDVANMNSRLEELLNSLQKKEEEKPKNVVLWVLAAIGAVTAVAAIAYAVYRYFTPDYLEDFEDDFDDDFDDYFDDEEEDKKSEEKDGEASEEE